MNIKGHPFDRSTPAVSIGRVDIAGFRSKEANCCPIDFIDVFVNGSCHSPTRASADEARDANIQVTVTPNAQTINPGESGEYTVRVYNSGSNPVTVQLSTAEGQDQDCSAYTSTITQIPGPIDSGSYEEASMNVTLAQNAEGSVSYTHLTLPTTYGV